MKGFIFSSDVRRGNSNQDSSQKDEVVFYGILEDGRCFTWTETNPYNIVFIPEGQSLPKDFYYKKTTGFQDYLGNKVVAHFCFNQKNILSYARTVTNFPMLEANISPATQFLLAKNLRSSVEFLDEPVVKKYKGTEVATFHNARVKFAAALPLLRVLSFDIEMGTEDNLLYSIALYGENYEKVIVLAEKDEELDGVSYVSSEKSLLQRFFDEIHRFNPHVFTGWYINGFDFRYLSEKSKDLGIPFSIGSLGEEVQIFNHGRGKEEYIHIPGRIVIDGFDVAHQLLEKKPENMRLETVAHYLLGKGKSISKEGKEKVEEITRMFYEDKKALAHYNLLDAKLAYDIVQKLEGVSYCQLHSSLSAVPIDRLNSYNEIFTSVYLKKMHALKIASFQRQISRNVLSEGQYDYRWKGGFYKNVAIFSLSELFLFVIVLYGIDPLGMISVSGESKNTVVSPKGFSFHKELSLTRDIILKLLDLRAKNLQSSKDGFMSLETKVINRQLYVLVRALLQSECSFAVSGLKNAIRENAFYLVEKFCDEFRKEGVAEVIYADCERLVLSFPSFGQNEEKSMHDQCEKVLDFIKNLIASWYDKSSLFSLLKLDQTYKDFFLMDHHITSLERFSFRFDAINFDGIYCPNDLSRKTLPLMKRFQQELQYVFFQKKDPKEYILQFKQKLFAGDYDKEIFLSKKISKNLDEYLDKKDRPLHIQAAFQIQEKIEEQKKKGNRRPTVNYYVSVKGPCANQGGRHISIPPDYNWYLENKIFSIASKILKHTENADLLDFIKNKDCQLDLFSF